MDYKEWRKELSQRNSQFNDKVKSSKTGGTYWWWWAFARHPHTHKMKFMVDGEFMSEEKAYESGNILLSGQEFEVFSNNSKDRNKATQRARQLFAEKKHNVNIALQNASHKMSSMDKE